MSEHERGVGWIHIRGVVTPGIDRLDGSLRPAQVRAGPVGYDEAVTELGSCGVTRRPWLFLVLVLVASAPFWLLAVLTRGQGWFLGLPVSVVMIIVPAAVASVLGVKEGGRTGLHALWLGVFDVARVRPGWWWVVGLGAVPVSALLAWVLGARPAADSAAAVWFLAPVYFAVFYLGAIPEEVGWSSYATPPLVGRLGVLGAGGVIGVVWEVWHWVPFWAQGRSWDWILGMLVFGVLSRTLMVLLYHHGGGGLAMVCAFHAMLNTVPLFPAGFTGFDPWLACPGMLAVLMGAMQVARFQATSPPTI